jgi:hypothetical protein
MGLFSRHSRDDPAPPGQSLGQASGQPGQLPGPEHSRLLVAGLAEYAASQGWRPAGEPLLNSETLDFVHDATRTMFGAPRSGIATYKIRVSETRYRDSYCGQVDGHEFMVANGWTSVVDLHAVSVCKIQLGWFLSEPVWIEPARFTSVMAHIRQIETRDPAFDRQFRVHGAHAETVGQVVGPDVRRLIMARDDWFFFLGGTDLLCVCREGYRSPDDLRGRLAEVSGILRAMPPPATMSAAAQPISLSGGVVFDPAHIAEWKAALGALPPGQQRQLKDELRARLAERRAQRPDEPRR